jgi:hypothetical protein
VLTTLADGIDEGSVGQTLANAASVLGAQAVVAQLPTEPAATSTGDQVAAAALLHLPSRTRMFVVVLVLSEVAADAAQLPATFNKAVVEALTAAYGSSVMTPGLLPAVPVDLWQAENEAVAVFRTQ